MKIAIILSFAVCIMLALTDCQKNLTGTATTAPPAANFYYWKTSLEFSKADQALADSLGMEKLYLRYFDVDWSPTHDMPVPVGELVIDDWDESSWLYDDEAKIANFQVVPTIFITNRTFLHNADLDSLAIRIAQKVEDMSQTLRWKIGEPFGSTDDPEITDWEVKDSLYQLIGQSFQDRISEVQIDCDWTERTRISYFSFLEKIKAAIPGMDITCTVRLHQFRDGKKAGIPPVDRATLMCYNVAPPAELSTADAIFDPALVEGYLKNTDYPLPLEAALPLFSWGVLFHENQFRGLASDLSAGEVEGNMLFEKLENGRYRFTQDTVFAGVYMREGDLLRFDGPTTAELSALASRLRQTGGIIGLSFFDWNADKIREYHVDEIFKKFTE